MMTKNNFNETEFTDLFEKSVKDINTLKGDYKFWCFKQIQEVLQSYLNYQISICSIIDYKLEVKLSGQLFITCDLKYLLTPYSKEQEIHLKSRMYTRIEIRNILLGTTISAANTSFVLMKMPRSLNPLSNKEFEKQYLSTPVETHNQVECDACIEYERRCRTEESRFIGHEFYKLDASKIRKQVSAEFQIPLDTKMIQRHERCVEHVLGKDPNEILQHHKKK